MALVGHWKLDGDALDSSGNEFHGTLTDTTSVNGVINDAYSFNGTSSYLQLGDVVSPKRMSISFWVYIDASQVWSSRFDILTGTQSGGTGRIIFYRVNTTTVRLFYHTGTIYTVDIPNSIQNLVGRWCHVCLMVADSSNEGIMQLSVNGEIQSSIVIDTEYTYANSDFYFMSDRGDRYFTNGLIDDIRIYDHILSLRDLKSISQPRELNVREEYEINKELRLWYGFDEFQEPTENLADPVDEGVNLWNATDNAWQYEYIDRLFGKRCVKHIKGTGAFSYSMLANATRILAEGKPLDTEYTLSLWAKPIANVNEIRLRCELRTATGGTDRFSIINEFIPIEMGWHHYEVTAVFPSIHPTTSDPIVDIYPIFGIQGEVTDTAELLVDGLQLEAKEYSTPFTNAKRNLLVPDLSGNNNDAIVTGPFIPRFDNHVDTAVIERDTIYKTTITSAWDTGALSYDRFRDNSFLEFRVDYEGRTTQGAEMVGITSAHTTWGFADINYAIYTHTDQNVRIYENGTNRGIFSTWSRDGSDLFRIEVSNGFVYYYQNGSIIYTSNIIPTFPWFFSASLHSHGTPNKIKNIRMGNLPSSTSTPVWSSDSLIGAGSFEFDGNESGVEISNPLSIFNKSFTISMWCYFNDDSRGILLGDFQKPNAINVSFEKHTDRRLRLYWDASPDIFTLNDVVELNKWHHIVLVVDRVSFVTDQTRFYVDTVNVHSHDAELSLKAAVGLHSIGRDNRTGTTVLNGLIDDVKIYSTALTAEDIQELYETKASLDSEGNFYNRGLREVGFKHTNLINYTTWVSGTTGSQPGFSVNGDVSENHLITSQDPWDKSTTVWEARPDAVSGPDGGWNGASFLIDNTKMYRFSVWIRRTVLGNGSAYLGCRGFGTTDGVLHRDNVATNQTNPYFWLGAWPSDTGDNWILIVGHVWPTGSGSGANYKDSGRYTKGGAIYGPITRDFVWRPETESTLHRAYLFYSTDTTTRQQFVYPRVDLIDGNEPSIGELVNGFDSEFYDDIEASHNDIFSFPQFRITPIYTESNSFSELETVTSGMVGWWPLDGNSKDLGGGSNGTVVDNSQVITNADWTYDNELNKLVLETIPGQCVDIGNAAFFPNNHPFTICGWNKYNAISTRDMLASRNSSFKGSAPYAWLLGTISGTSMSAYDGSTWHNISFTFELSTWYFLTFAFDGTTMNYYVNGNLIGTAAWSFSDNAAYNTQIGGYTSAGVGDIDGRTSDVRAYNRVLSLSEVQYLYNEVSAVKPNLDNRKDKLIVKNRLKEY